MFYQKNKGKLSKKAREKYQNLSEEEKRKKRQYSRERQSVNMVVSDIKNFERMKNKRSCVYN